MLVLTTKVMDILTLKTLARHIQKKTWDNKSLSIVWIRALGKIMQLNRNLHRYIHKIRYQGDDLKIDYEWARVVYGDIDPNTKNYKMRALRHHPNVPGYLSTNLRSVKTRQHWQDRRLPLMPYIRSKDRGKIMREVSVIVKYGTPHVEVDINKNAISRRFFTENMGRKLSPSMLEFVYHVGQSQMRNRVNLAMVLREDPVVYDVYSDFSINPLKCNLELGKYQLENIRWFLELERKVPVPIHYTKACRFGKYFIDPFEKKLYRTKPEYEEMKLMGGALLDEMGLGKTVVMVVASLLNPADKSVGTPDGYVFSTLKRTCSALITSKGSKSFGKECGVAVKEELEVYCKKHRRKFPDSQLQAPPRNIQVDESYYTIAKGQKLLKSRATLIICPNTVPDHWVSQCHHVTRTTGQKLKIVKITCQKEYNQYCYRDLINADFVIVSFDFIAKNPALKTIPVRPIYASALYTSPAYLPYLRWHRIIVDEIHEVQDAKYRGSRLMDYVLNLSSNYRWCMSGSAFTKAHKAYELVVDYLMNSHNSANVFHYLERGHHKNLISTFQSTCAEKVTEIPPVMYKEVWLDFSPTERAMYKTRLLTSQKKGDPCKDEYLRQLCCHPQLSAETKDLLKNCGSLGQIHSSMKRQTQDFIEQRKRELVHLQDRLEYLKEFLDPGQRSIKSCYIVQDDCPDYLMQYRMTKGQITRKNKQITNLRKALSFYDDSSDINQSNQPKSMLDKLEVVDSGDSGESEDGDDMQYLIHLYGTKMGHLIKYFRTTFKENPEDRIIIFSQWDTLLKNIQVTLKQNGIESLCCKGSIFQKKKAVERFKNNSKGIRILMLSTKYAASGLDLMEANKIILFDPVYGTEKYKHGIEAQAIGRAARLGQKRDIEVIRFLVRDTIEEEIHFSGVPKTEICKIKVI